MMNWLRKKKEKNHSKDKIYNDHKKVSDRLADSEHILRQAYSKSSDIVIKSFTFGKNMRTQALLIYLSGTVDVVQIDEHVLKSLHLLNDQENDLESIKNALTVPEIIEVNHFDRIYHEISNGHPVLFIDHLPLALSLGLSKWATRQVEDSSTETVIRGPKEGFVESLETNTSLIRKRIRTPRLKIEQIIVGKYSRTPVVISYIDGLCDPSLVEEIVHRIKKIAMDGIFESGMIQEQIQDAQWSPFPTIFSTERPDSFCGALIEGRAGILIDGSPFALILPSTFFMFFSSPEDYYSGFIIGTAIRLLRISFLFIALLGPSLYVAVTTFHQEMIPTTLLISIAQSHEQVPFPTVVEAILMEVTFEALREAGLRLPRQVGPAISIVGALVIGQAAIQASLVSPLMVIVVAITAIASFMIPHYDASNTVRLLRFPIILLTSMFGLLGIIFSVIAILIHLCSLRSFGVPYLEPLAPFKKAGSIDTLIRGPLWKMNIRPHFTGTLWNKKRSGK
ncbi:spore germination protein [Sporolactobacillus laevolacticus]|uniref:Membrane protein n=1 Tax=Sporolactobacillus laevolacticus DSM 442 TaxID=1395513 RepID=V6IUH9_9BACL|nr:spore germination protein [Sporolactobacillus laevolacticus]EST10748.1 membrane protein [Sporolactobacillus laevolacticus DSM 442]